MEFLLSHVPSISPAFWAILGLVLMCVEVLAPIAIFMWFGLSAFVVALVGWVCPVSPEMQCIVYAIAAPIVTWGGRRRFPPADQTSNANEYMNNKMDQMVGKTFVLAANLANDAVQMPVGNSTWMVTGPHLAAGTRVKIVCIDGVMLYVEAVYTH